MLLLFLIILIGGEGPDSGGIGPTPDVADDNRRRIGMLVMRAGVGRRGRG